jgi:hypothetical protein
MGTRTQKRGDRGRRRTEGRINRGGGNGGEPVGAHQLHRLVAANVVSQLREQVLGTTEAEVLFAHWFSVLHEEA